MHIGVISDTHGLLRPEVIEALRGSERIIHAGDVGAAEILERLAKVAPVTAIRGNVDKGAWARRLPETEVLEVGGISIYVLHDLAELDLKPEAAGFAAVISGHSHIPKQEVRAAVLYFNPRERGAEKVQVAGDSGQAGRERWHGARRDREDCRLKISDCGFQMQVPRRFTPRNDNRDRTADEGSAAPFTIAEECPPFFTSRRSAARRVRGG